MTVQDFVPLVGILLASVWISWGMEGLAPVHPMVRRGVQGAVLTAAGIYLLHALRVF